MRRGGWDRLKQKRPTGPDHNLVVVDIQRIPPSHHNNHFTFYIYISHQSHFWLTDWPCLLSLVYVTITGFEIIIKYNFTFNLIGWEQKSSLHSRVNTQTNNTNYTYEYEYISGTQYLLSEKCWNIFKLDKVSLTPHSPL